MEINEISGQIVDAGMKVHTALGPGLLESAYEACLLFELHRRGLNVQRQVTYLKLSGKKLGLLMNFNTEHLKDGITRIANGL